MFAINLVISFPNISVLYKDVKHAFTNFARYAVIGLGNKVLVGSLESRNP